jgi:hypothetical protein
MITGATASASAYDQEGVVFDTLLRYFKIYILQSVSNLLKDTTSIIPRIASSTISNPNLLHNYLIPAIAFANSFLASMFPVLQS